MTNVCQSYARRKGDEKQRINDQVSFRCFHFDLYQGKLSNRQTRRPSKEKKYGQAFNLVRMMYSLPSVPSFHLMRVVNRKLYVLSIVNQTKQSKSATFEEEFIDPHIVTRAKKVTEYVIFIVRQVIITAMSILCFLDFSKKVHWINDFCRKATTLQFFLYGRWGLFHNPYIFQRLFNSIRHHRPPPQ